MFFSPSWLQPWPDTLLLTRFFSSLYPPPTCPQYVLMTVNKPSLLHHTHPLLYLLLFGFVFLIQLSVLLSLPHSESCFKQPSHYVICFNLCRVQSLMVSQYESENFVASVQNALIHNTCIMTAISGNRPLDVMYSSSSAVAGNPSIINPVDLYNYVCSTHTQIYT